MLVSLTALRFTVIKSCLEAFSVAERQYDSHGARMQSAQVILLVALC